jgi:hypothetical protein
VGWDQRKVEIEFENIDISILLILKRTIGYFKHHHTDDVKQIIVLSAEAEPTRTNKNKKSTSINTSKHRYRLDVAYFKE